MSTTATLDREAVTNRRPVTIAVVGAGARGRAYAELVAERPDRARIVGVAEPRPERRNEFATRFDLDTSMVFEDWHALVAEPRRCDVVVLAVLDRQHREAALALIDRGYDLLLEKPIAPNLEDSLSIVEAAEAAGVTVAICHVMRYTDYTKELTAQLDAGVIGEIVSIEHLEPIGYYHFAHSFVRGNWRREDESSSLLLAKSCHDIDWLDFLVGAPARRVSSFGSLTHFRPEQQPAGAADRCVDCAVEAGCPFSALKLYRDGLRKGGTKAYFTRVMAKEFTEQSVTAALEEGPYGRCVYRSDNDVPDHQVVSIEYDGGVTVSFTLTAFTPLENRRTKIFGTRGQLTGDGQRIEIYDFLTERTTIIDTSTTGASAAEGHGGGDGNLIRNFVDALYEGRPELIQTGLRESLDSHRLVFAAERARKTGQVVEL